MTEPEQTDEPQDPAESEQSSEPPDPKEAMRLALERKKQKEHHSPVGGINADRDQGGRAHSQVGGKREFRRKSG